MGVPLPEEGDGPLSPGISPLTRRRKSTLPWRIPRVCARLDLHVGVDRVAVELRGVVADLQSKPIALLAVGEHGDGDRPHRAMLSRRLEC